MSNIIIYLPNEPLGKQGGMEKATHQWHAFYEIPDTMSVCSVSKKTG